MWVILSIKFPVALNILNVELKKIDYNIKVMKILTYIIILKLAFSFTEISVNETLESLDFKLHLN